MPRVFESNFCWKARVQTQAYLRGNTQMRNSTREKMARTHDIPNAKQLISGGNDFLTWSFQSLRRVKFSLLAWPLHWFSLPPLADESLNLTTTYWVGQKVFSGFSIASSGKTQTNVLANSIHHGSLISTSAMERQYATNISTKAPHKNKPISGQIPDPDDLCLV